ncbi:hypothetical protein Pla175_43630 [Pirellulimonas nuda]|uniref:Uncharacterized protein n=1 Tax=Pirellulimonas nuda TaxID=2528009 RepID=A0A518DHJ9_9BACT|nr:hypothetical protein [Pirellulimonas nuda]QDU90949.1 hypothetical protein Pla175_43630 [Pirellulimonas nuda]
MVSAGRRLRGPPLDWSVRPKWLVAMRMVTFDQLMAMWAWDAIPNCPGRFKLSGGPTALLVSDLVGCDVELRTYSAPPARDTIFVAVLGDFGIISYRRADGLFVHTLNTPAGLQRKLLSLGITNQ